MDAARFLTSFTHTVLVEPGRELSFVIGPENPDFVPYEEISPYLINSIMTTEDNGFLRHRGFITPEFRSALQSNLERGYFRLGASSITMQMVKNVLLSREKTLSRKLQEMFLTWYLETNLTDDQELIKALSKGFSVSQYRQQQAKLKKPVLSPTDLPPPPAAAPSLPATPAAGAVAGQPPGTPTPAPTPNSSSVLAIAKPFEGAPTGQSNLYAVAQARQALREISPIKKRILEIYFNAIEFGPYIFGIGRATRHYFGKAPKDLTPREASFFSSILPNPKRRYIQYCKGAADDAWEKYVDRIVRRVHSRGRLTDEELQQAVTSKLVFDRTEALPDKECLALIQHLTELPPPTATVQPPAPGTPAPASPPSPPSPLPSDKPFPLPPWITVHSGGKLRYRSPDKAPEKVETDPEPVVF
jgi:CRISPR/Cas system endoribonuclease Cas6 (RAMP superfamily)